MESDLSIPERQKYANANQTITATTANFRTAQYGNYRIGSLAATAQTRQLRLRAGALPVRGPRGGVRPGRLGAEPGRRRAVRSGPGRRAASLLHRVRVPVEPQVESREQVLLAEASP